MEKSFTCKHKGIHGQQLTFNCDDNGKGTVKFMQPVLIKKINDKYKMSDGPVSKTPAVAGQVLMKVDEVGTVSPKQIKCTVLPL